MSTDKDKFSISDVEKGLQSGLTNIRKVKSIQRDVTNLGKKSSSLVKTITGLFGKK